MHYTVIHCTALLCKQPLFVIFFVKLVSVSLWTLKELANFEPCGIINNLVPKKSDVGKTTLKVWVKRSTLKNHRKQGNYTKEHIFSLTLMLFGTFLAKLGLGKKIPIFSNVDFIHLKIKFGASNYKFILHWTNILILIFNFDQKYIFFLQNLTTNAVFTVGVPVKSAFIGYFHRFQEEKCLPKKFCRTEKMSGLCIKVVIRLN